MTNFDFLQKDSQFQAFSDACIEAENSISASPALCALGVRKSAELAVKWLYSIDPSLQAPYKDNFSALVFNPTFTDSVDEDILNRLRFIIKLGNFAAHTSRPEKSKLQGTGSTFLNISKNSSTLFASTSDDTIQAIDLVLFFLL